MVSWSEFTAVEPELAGRVRAVFDRNKHKTMATLRKDGSPRISGTEADFKDGELWLGSMPDARKANDLLRDPRVAIHGPTTEPDEAGSMEPDAKIAGKAIEVTDPEILAKFGEGAPPGPFHLFRVDVTEVAVTGVDGDPPDHLVIDFWTADGGRQTVKRQ